MRHFVNKVNVVEIGKTNKKMCVPQICRMRGEKAIKFVVVVVDIRRVMEFAIARRRECEAKLAVKKLIKKCPEWEAFAGIAIIWRSWCRQRRLLLLLHCEESLQNVRRLMWQLKAQLNLEQKAEWNK